MLSRLLAPTSLLLFFPIRCCFPGLILCSLDLRRNNFAGLGIDLYLGDTFCAAPSDIERPDQLSVFALKLFALDYAVRNVTKRRFLSLSLRDLRLF